MNKINKKNIERKITSFCQEVGEMSMNDEQKRIYRAFTLASVKPYRFVVTDKYDNTVRFVLYTNKCDDGVLHILSKHYNGIGKVSAQEILNLCDVIRLGNLSVSENTMLYTLKRNGQTFKLIVALKKSKTGNNVLKSFYSNRK